MVPPAGCSFTRNENRHALQKGGSRMAHLLRCAQRVCRPRLRRPPGHEVPGRHSATPALHQTGPGKPSAQPLRAPIALICSSGQRHMLFASLEHHNRAIQQIKLDAHLHKLPQRAAWQLRFGPCERQPPSHLCCRHFLRRLSRHYAPLYRSQHTHYCMSTRMTV